MTRMFFGSIVDASRVAVEAYLKYGCTCLGLARTPFQEVTGHIHRNGVRQQERIVPQVGCIAYHSTNTNNKSNR